jgi:transposase
MKKRVYQAVTIKKINIEKLLEFTSSKRIVFSVDAAKEDFYGALLNEEKIVLQTIKWQSPDNVEQMLDLLEGLKAKRLEVVLEPTGTYGDTFREQAQKRGFPIYLMSPKRVYDAREIFDGVPSSHDAKAASIIGKLHLDGLSKTWPEKSERQRQLAAALSMADIYHRQYHDNLNRLEAQLARVWPELPRILPLTSASLPALLMSYGSPRKTVADAQNARDLLKKTSNSALSHSKIGKVIESAANTIGVAMILEEEEAIERLAAEIERNRVALRESKKKVERIMSSADLPDGIKKMSAAAGAITTATLLCKLGEPTLYDSAGAWLKAAGLNLKERSSGMYKGVLKITKRGPGSVRRYLYMMALRYIGFDEVTKRWYAKKVKRDGGKKRKAIVALMRKLLSGLWRVGRDGVAFDSDKLFDKARLPAV